MSYFRDTTPGDGHRLDGGIIADQDNTKRLRDAAEEAIKLGVNDAKATLKRQKYILMFIGVIALLFCISASLSANDGTKAGLQTWNIIMACLSAIVFVLAIWDVFYMSGGDKKLQDMAKRYVDNKDKSPYAAL